MCFLHRAFAAHPRLSCENALADRAVLCIYVVCVLVIVGGTCSCRTRRCCAWRRCSSRSSSSTRPAAWRHCKPHCCSIHDKKSVATVISRIYPTQTSHVYPFDVNISRTYLTYISHVIIYVLSIRVAKSRALTGYLELMLSEVKKPPSFAPFLC